MMDERGPEQKKFLRVGRSRWILKSEGPTELTAHETLMDSDSLDSYSTYVVIVIDRKESLIPVTLFVIMIRCTTSSCGTWAKVDSGHPLRTPLTVSIGQKRRCNGTDK